MEAETRLVESLLGSEFAKPVSSGHATVDKKVDSRDERLVRGRIGRLMLPQ
jgi:hypothetical protein